MVHSKSLFDHALDTFKAFSNLTVENSGFDQDEFPASIWQILHHIISWQSFQLGQLQGAVSEKPFEEEATWCEEKCPTSDVALQAAVMEFDGQLERFQKYINQLDAIGEQGLKEQRIIQDVALHLSFHLGEVVLIRRLKGSYPLPHQMKEFLQA